MTRVQIPAYTDRWMRGDRYGKIIGTYTITDFHKPPKDYEMARVRLDKSGKEARVILADCEVIE